MLLVIFILPDNFISASHVSFCDVALSVVSEMHADHIK